MKKYRIYYTIKMNSSAYEYFLDVEAGNVKAAKDRVRVEVFRLTGRNTFNPSTKAYKEDKAIEGMPPKKPEWIVEKSALSNSTN